MDKTLQRSLSFLVALIMVLSLIPVTQLEAKAAATASTITLNRTDGKTVTVDLDTVNDSLVPIGDVAEDGTMTAFCAACGENAVWELLTENTEPKVALKTDVLDQSHVHYYLNKDVTTSKSISLGVEGADWVCDAEWVLDLNGKTLDLGNVKSLVTYGDLTVQNHPIAGIILNRKCRKLCACH